MAAFVSIVGRKGSGKSKVIEGLIACLSQRGLRVGVLKRLAREDVEIDDPGTDTYRYRHGGARAVVLAGRRRLALFQNLEQEQSLAELSSFFGGFDLVLLEGYTPDEVPKIEVYRKAPGDLLLSDSLENMLAVCTDEPTDRAVPHFSLRSLDALAAFIETQVVRKGAEVA